MYPWRGLARLATAKKRRRRKFGMGGGHIGLPRECDGYGRHSAISRDEWTDPTRRRL